MRNTSRFILALIFLSLAGASCRKFINIDPPADQLVSSHTFSSDQTAEAALVGLYSEMMKANNTLTSAGITILTGLTADELVYNGSTPGLLEFFQNSIGAENTNNSTLWKSGYSYVYHANSIIEGIEASVSVSDSVRRQVLGEAIFLRAFLHFYLSGLYGDVPLVTTTHYEVNASMARMPVDEVLAQVMEDLTQAVSLLPASSMGNNRGRVSATAARALLARVYLLKEEWEKAEEESTKVINTPGLSLLADLNAVFLKNSAESILQFHPVNPNLNTYEGNTFIPSSPSVRPNYSLPNYLLDSMEVGDKRRLAWLKSNVVGGTAYYYPYKYKVRTGATFSEGYTVLRLAEQYLLRAEARAMLGRLEGPDGALADLNKLRNRAGLGALPGLSSAETLAAIEKEERVEMFCEWGYRWFSLKRRDLLTETLTGIKSPNWQASDALFPIPQPELERNPFLIQNPGY